MRIKTNKTQLYKLVSEYTALPQPKGAQFYKVRGHASYFLEWLDGHGNKGRASLSASMGSPLLTIESGDVGEPYTDWKAHRLTTETLQERGMVEYDRAGAEN